ncbi:hypothetical protein AVEN_51699-1 [Araneus ventricosus]|uniref:Uncharacterized protein n=1 Tax=Araneus ventricosus TaxID=182803 RepID=A0A4Y2U778_ARAVE|nr:hypothetical protein AVEN_51699-1 [Araneus ventricosus]
MDAPFSLQMYWQYLRAMILRTQQMNSGMLKPAYPCDVWHQETSVSFSEISATPSLLSRQRPTTQTAGRIRIECFKDFPTVTRLRGRKTRPTK